ncbi:MAG: LicD family protein [Eubacterium sp.]|nr:LicD family protein [Eubacterium sp.]
MSEQKDIELREYQLILLGILKDVAAVCREHNIRFYLGEGTMLGAIRHKGFIPWDDDIDIIMYRKDYERFLEVAPEALGEKYEVQSHERLESFWNVYAQVRLITDDERLRQKYIEHLLENNGPFVDIFPMDYVPKKDGMSLSWKSFRIRYYKAMLPYKYKVCEPLHLRGKVLNLLSKIHKKETLFKRIKKITGKCGKERLEYTVNFHTTHPLQNQVAPSECYDEAIEWEFEDTTMPVPKGYDEILTIIYGDYMTPPKETERTQKHNIGSE